MSHRRSLLAMPLFALVFALMPLPVLAQDDDTADEPAPVVTAIESWIALPAVEVLTPAFTEDDGKALDDVILPLGGLEPGPGDTWRWPGSDDAIEWTSVDGAAVELGSIDENATIRLLATRVRADGFTKATIRVKSFHRLKVLLDGAEIGSKESLEDFEDEDSEPGEVEEKIELTTGDHTLIVVAEGVPDRDEAWSVEAEVEVAADHADRVSVDADVMRRARLTDIFDLHSPSGLEMSPDGGIVAMNVNSLSAPREDRRRWMEFVETESGDVVGSLEGVGTLSGFEWAPDDPADRYSFITRDDGKATLYVSSIRGGSPTIVVEGIEDFGGHRWMPDGASIVFSKSVDGPEDPDDFKRYRGLSDRWGGSRNVRSLHQVSVPDGIVRRLTAGVLSTSLQSIHPDGRALLFTRSLRDDATWPFSRSELVELDMTTLDTEVLATEGWGLGADYDRSGARIAITAPADAFAGVGRDVDPDVEINLYDSQLYLMDRSTKDVRAISRGFDPGINSVAWVGNRDELLVQATDREWGRIYKYDLRRQNWQELETEAEIASSLSVAHDGSAVAFLAQGTNMPPRVQASKIRSWDPKTIRAFDTERLDQISFGEVKDFDVALGEDTIVGRVYYPPNFDESRVYPTIVYYYGGTSPVTRSFGGRYPKEWWAANGYLVYVMQPSGATGFGQEWAARHVNNWGKTVADEIVECTKKYLEAHSFADPDRLGCIGASYGGFMTMLLTTRTDIFSAAVSHAGISSISSYWGEGNWGFAYSAAATAKSYPWNRPDIYVDQSPLFAADQVTTPLLLLHGDVDNNVPPGESEQFYTALRVLGKEVEYIRIDGELHWILQYERRKRWSESIVAWFDKHLKDDAGWWDHLWPADE